ncbi:hypothetical protein HanXRQr2_Chr14g0637201 [Helianthus annuus]|uniref:Uncharacterized protein n=1 Tax=Helianthus annuus TaxID=4232 RepID=A0A251SJK3_HELAN|nr:hypothetical protein HanXRQr2_Chr14g0637201 [Helianthus annuus]
MYFVISISNKRTRFCHLSTPQATILLSFLHGNPWLLLFHMSFYCDFFFFFKFF